MQDNEELWKEAYAVFESGDEDRAISLFTELSDSGDWSGSYMLGYIYQERGLQDYTLRKPHRPNFLLAARWYSRSLSQEEQCLPHYGLARHYYYGLGGKCDYKLAFEHLEKSCLDQKPLAQAMMAELLWHGLGVAKNLREATKLFTCVADMGYVAGLVGLKRMAIAERNFLQAILYFSRSVSMGINLVLKDKKHARLSGIGGKWGDVRIDANGQHQGKPGTEKVMELYSTNRDL